MDNFFGVRVMDGNKREHETHVLTKFVVERLWFVVLACMEIILMCMRYHSRFRVTLGWHVSSLNRDTITSV